MSSVKTVPHKQAQFCIRSLANLLVVTSISGPPTQRTAGSCLCRSRWFASSSKPHWQTTRFAPVFFTCDKRFQVSHNAWKYSGTEPSSNIIITQLCLCQHKFIESSYATCIELILSNFTTFYIQHNYPTDKTYLFNHFSEFFMLIFNQFLVILRVSDVQLVSGFRFRWLKRTRQYRNLCIFNFLSRLYIRTNYHNTCSCKQWRKSKRICLCGGKTEANHDINY